MAWHVACLIYVYIYTYVYHIILYMYVHNILFDTLDVEICDFLYVLFTVMCQMLDILWCLPNIIHLITNLAFFG